jgi:hypothetical protein
MNHWFRFGQMNHIQVKGEIQRAGCGTIPKKRMPTFESDGPPKFPCPRCLLVWLDDQIVEEELDDAVARGYTEAEASQE